MEFFSNVDPLYRSYGKQEALRKQTEYFENQAIEQSWIQYNAGFKAFSHFVRFSENPWGDLSNPIRARVGFHWPVAMQIVSIMSCGVTKGRQTMDIPIRGTRTGIRVRLI